MADERIVVALFGMISVEKGLCCGVLHFDEVEVEANKNQVQLAVLSSLSSLMNPARYLKLTRVPFLKQAKLQPCSRRFDVGSFGVILVSDDSEQIYLLNQNSQIGCRTYDVYHDWGISVLTERESLVRIKAYSTFSILKVFTYVIDTRRKNSLTPFKLHNDLLKTPSLSISTTIVDLLKQTFIVASGETPLPPLFQKNT